MHSCMRRTNTQNVVPWRISFSKYSHTNIHVWVDGCTHAAGVGKRIFHKRQETCAHVWCGGRMRAHNFHSRLKMLFAVYILVHKHHVGHTHTSYTHTNTLFHIHVTNKPRSVAHLQRKPIYIFRPLAQAHHHCWSRSAAAAASARARDVRMWILKRTLTPSREHKHFDDVARTSGRLQRTHRFIGEAEHVLRPIGSIYTQTHPKYNLLPKYVDVLILENNIHTCRERFIVDIWMVHVCCCIREMFCTRGSFDTTATKVDLYRINLDNKLLCDARRQSKHNDVGRNL